MSDDPLAFLDEKPGSEEPAQEPAQAEAPEPAATPEPAQPEPAATEPEPVAAEAAQPVGVVPIAALMAERDKRQELERQLAQLAPIEPPAMPSEQYLDPVQQLAVQQHQLRYQISEAKAEVRHGEDLVREAKQWAIQRAQQDPLFDARIDRAPDPFTQIVEDYKREQMLSQVTPEVFAQFQAWRAAQQQQPATPVAAPAVAVSPPPASMTSLKSVAQAGGVAPPKAKQVVSEQEVFDAMFG
jgi:hypothetical protein